MVTLAEPKYLSGITPPREAPNRLALQWDIQAPQELR